MIFVTVGAQMPFDRLVRAVDAWAGLHPGRDVFAQIGPTSLVPRHLQWTTFIEPAEFHDKMSEADLVVAHAGMGTIISAMQYGKPILVMPRRGDLRETRNDHQVATARRFLEIGRIAVAMDEQELTARLDDPGTLEPPVHVGPFAAPELIDALRNFIAGTDQRPDDNPADSEGSDRD